MPGFTVLRSKTSAEPTLWMVLNALLLGCIVVTFLANVRGTSNEVKRANENGQRAVIDAVTGNVSLGVPRLTQSEFDVGSQTPKAPAAEEAPPAGDADTVEADPVPTDALLEGLPTLRTQPLSDKLPEDPSGTVGLVAAPAPEVSEKVDGVVLPKRNGSASPFTIYAQRFERKPEQKLLTFVILDAGLSTQSLPLVLTLPREVTVAFSPYSADVTARVAKMRRAGYEVWSMLPAMGARYPQDDPGPLGLASSLPKDELMRRLHWIMADTIGSVGVVLPPDETLSTKAAIFSPILADIDNRGLGILTTHPTRTSKQISGSQSLKSLVARADVLLDPAPNAQEIERKLAEITKNFETADSQIVAMSARPQTLLLVQKWLKEHPPESPITLAPLSSQWQPKEAAPTDEAEESAGGHGAPKKEEKKSSGHGSSGGTEKKKPSGGGHH